MQSDTLKSVLSALAALRAQASTADDLESLITALCEARDVYEDERAEMISPHNRCHCCDCGRDFTIPITVKRERQWGLPENCPSCFKVASGQISQWEGKATYL